VLDPHLPCNSQFEISADQALQRSVEANATLTALCWLRMAAQAGNASEGRLAFMYYKGMGVAVDLHEAAALAQQAAERGDYFGEGN
jgi:TPR repeat protein